MSQTAPEGLARYLRMMSDRNASDLHFKAGARPAIRVHSELAGLEGEPIMTDESITRLFYPLFTERQRAQYEERGSLDIGLTLAEAGRFRINVFRQRGVTSVAVRRVHRLISSFE